MNLGLSRSHLFPQTNLHVEKREPAGVRTESLHCHQDVCARDSGSSKCKQGHQTDFL